VASEAPKSERSEVEVLQSRVRELEAELATLRTAHDAQARFLVQERLALADEIEREMEVLQEEIEWRKGVMEHQQEVIERFQNSHLVRYTAPLRKVARAFRRS
jgi:hypothetical protein